MYTYIITYSQKLDKGWERQNSKMASRISACWCICPQNPLTLSVGRTYKYNEMVTPVIPVRILLAHKREIVLLVLKKKVAVSRPHGEGSPRCSE